MENKSNNGIIILLSIIIITILTVLCVLFATGKITLNNQNEINNENISNSTIQNNNSQTNYESFIGKWTNTTTKNEITIKNVTDNQITFTWFLYRLAGIDDDTTIPFKDGKAVFYYQGYDDKNYDGKHTEDEKYMRKATITLNDNGVTVDIIDVDSIDSKYVLTDNFAGSVYIKAGTYTHPVKE